MEGVSLAYGVDLIGEAPDETILEGTVWGLRSGNILSRLTVTAGSLGGIVIPLGESPTVQKCRIPGNSAQQGGGVWCYRSSPTLAGCETTGNSAPWHGGGLACCEASARIIGCEISRNGAGGTLLLPVVSHDHRLRDRR